MLECPWALSREDWACIGIIVMGIILFLVGANVYNAFLGYLGVFFLIGGVLALIALYIYNYLLSRRTPSSEEKPLNPPALLLN
jgi:membrane-bound ClpP family serine protease